MSDGWGKRDLVLNEGHLGDLCLLSSWMVVTGTGWRGKLFNGNREKHFFVAGKGLWQVILMSASVKRFLFVSCT